MKKLFIIFFCVIVILFVWHNILEKIFGYNLDQLSHYNTALFHLLMSPVYIFALFCCVYFNLGDDSEETPEENSKTETNIDNPKESEVVVVTEIQGERKIIKNGKVIYSEKLKADELKVFENLKDKN